MIGSVFGSMQPEQQSMTGLRHQAPICASVMPWILVASSAISKFTNCAIVLRLRAILRLLESGVHVFESVSAISSCVWQIAAYFAQVVDYDAKRNLLAELFGCFLDNLELVEGLNSYSYVFCLCHNVLVFLILFFSRTNIVPIFHKVNRLCEKKSLFFHNVHTFCTF